jgi:pimeloyl-ACP methyl ester carboxylesterase
MHCAKTPESMLNTRTETHNGDIPLRVAMAGEGECVIFLHGYPENLQVFSAIFPPLAGSHRVIAFDWPGMGYSAPWKGGLTPLLMAGRLAQLMQEWGIEKAHFIAQDMGAQPALLFAAKFPERVHSLVIMNALISDNAATSWEIDLLRKFRINRLLLRHFPGLVFFRAVQTFLPFRFRLPAALRAEMWRAFRQPAVRECIIRMCAGYDAQLKRLPEWYRDIRCPVLILWGEKDKHFPPRQADELAAILPHATLRIIKGGMHWMVLQKPDEVLRHIREFYGTAQ